MWFRDSSDSMSTAFGPVSNLLAEEDEDTLRKALKATIEYRDELHVHIKMLREALAIKQGVKHGPGK